MIVARKNQNDSLSLSSFLRLQTLVKNRLASHKVISQSPASFILLLVFFCCSLFIYLFIYLNKKLEKKMIGRFNNRQPRLFMCQVAWLARRDWLARKKLSILNSLRFAIVYEKTWILFVCVFRCCCCLSRACSWFIVRVRKSGRVKNKRLHHHKVDASDRNPAV